MTLKPKLKPNEVSIIFSGPYGSTFKIPKGPIREVFPVALKEMLALGLLAKRDIETVMGAPAKSGNDLFSMKDF